MTPEQLQAIRERWDTNITSEDSTDVKIAINGLCDEIERLRGALEPAKVALTDFVGYHGQGLGVMNWHQNGDVEPLDNFIEGSGLDEALCAVEKALSGEST